MTITLAGPDADLAEAVKDNDVQKLLEACDEGADPSQRNAETGRTLLFDVIDRIFDSDFADRKPSVTALLFALLEKGADVNLADKEGVTPLHYALGKGDARLVCSMIELGGADVTSAAPENGDTVLHRAAALYLAAEKNTGELITAVLSRGASPYVTNTGGVSAMDIAAAATGDQAEELRGLLGATAASRQLRLRELARKNPMKLRIG
jgi:ankyrin repeat protein